MTLAQTYSWIFYSIALASQIKAAKHNEIEGVADGINHAIPTQKEMRNSISWLNSNGFVQKEGKRIQLTDKGNKLLSNISQDTGTTSGAWASIEKHFMENGVNNVTEINPNTFNT